MWAQYMRAGLVLMGLSACDEDQANREPLRCQSVKYGDSQITMVTGVRHVYNLGLDATGHVYLPQFVDGTIVKLSPALELIGTLCGPHSGWQTESRKCSGERFNRPHAVTVDKAGHLYITEYRAGRVVKLTAKGELVKMWGNDPAEPMTLQGPVVAWPEHDGSIFVSDAKKHVVVRYNTEGTFMGWIGAGQDGTIRGGFSHEGDLSKPSDQPGGFNNPHLVKYGPDGMLYVADTGNHRIQKFTRDGHFAGWLGQSGDTAESGWHTTGRAKNSVQVGGFDTPTSFDFDADGNLYVIETTNSRLQKFRRDSGEVLWFGRVEDGTPGWRTSGVSVIGSEPGAFKYPYDVRLFGSRIYVSDTHNNRIQIISPSGEVGGPGAFPSMRCEVGADRV